MGESRSIGRLFGEDKDDIDVVSFAEGFQAVHIRVDRDLCRQVFDGYDKRPQSCVNDSYGQVLADAAVWQFQDVFQLSCREFRWMLYGGGGTDIDSVFFVDGIIHLDHSLAVGLDGDDGLRHQLGGVLDQRIHGGDGSMAAEVDLTL